MTLSRRSFLTQSAAGITLGFAGLHRLCAGAEPAVTGAAAGYGPLVPDARGILNLPAGFSYRVISQSGQEMDDGLLVPGLPDGMAAFPGPGGLTVLVRNHEMEPPEAEGSPFGPRGERLTAEHIARGWDLAGRTPSLGGTTTLVYDTRTNELKRQWLSLAGTNRNCAGGPTPWNSWLTCEEDVLRAGEHGQRDHGWVFEVPVTATPELHQAVPLRDMGRFYREAVAVDERTGIVYMTEDRSDAAFYRFIPNTPGKLAEGGTLQALRVRGRRPSTDTRNWGAAPAIPVGARLEVEWVTLDRVSSPNDELRHRVAEEFGGAVFARTEGIWAGADRLYIGCTTGGRTKLGQIWTYTPSPHEGTPGEREAPGVLELFIEPNDGALIENADNLTMAPWGDVIVCEDSRKNDRLVGVTPEGGLYTFAENVGSTTEFAGVCFSPDGSTLFVNMQYDGRTVAITGPWRQRGPGRK